MAYSGSEDEGIGLDDADFDKSTEGDDDIDDDILDALEGDLAREAAAEEATEADEVRRTVCVLFLRVAHCSYALRILLLMTVATMTTT